jgi:Ca2+-binding EF-hand superfamily protein
MSRLDENFDGRISYHELRDHIEKLGFDIGSLENDEGTKKLDVDHEEFMWRDKAVELIIRTL